MNKTYRVLATLALLATINFTALYTVTPTIKAAEVSQNTIEKDYTVSALQDSNDSESMAQKYLNPTAKVIENNGSFHVTLGISDIQVAKSTNLKFAIYDHAHHKIALDYNETSISFDVPSVSTAISMNVTYDVAEYNIHGDHDFRLFLSPIATPLTSTTETESENNSQSSSSDIVKNESIGSSENQSKQLSDSESIVNSANVTENTSQGVSSSDIATSPATVESSNTMQTDTSKESETNSGTTQTSTVESSAVQESTTMTDITDTTMNGSDNSKSNRLSDGKYEIPFSFWKENEDVQSSAQSFFKKAWLKIDGSTMKVALLAKNQFGLSLGNLVKDQQIPGVRLMENDTEFITELSVDSLAKPQLFYVSYQVGNRTMTHALRLVLDPEKSTKTTNYPAKVIEVNDGIYTLPFDVLKKDEDVSSGSKQFFKSAFVKVEDGKKYLTLVTINKYNLALGRVKNDQLIAGTRIYENSDEFATEMLVDSFEDPILIYVNYQAGPMNMTHQLRVLLDTSKLEATTHYPQSPTETKPTETKPTETAPIETTPTDTKSQVVGIKALQKDSNEPSIAQQYLDSTAIASKVKNGYNITINLKNIQVAREAGLNFFLYDQIGNKIPITYSENVADKLSLTFFVSSLDKEVLMNVIYTLGSLNIQGDHDFRLVFDSVLSENQVSSTASQTNDQPSEFPLNHTAAKKQNISDVLNPSTQGVDNAVDLGLTSLDRPAEMRSTGNSYTNSITSDNTTNPHTDASNSSVYLYVLLAIGSFSYILIEIYRKKASK